MDSSAHPRRYARGVDPACGRATVPFPPLHPLRQVQPLREPDEVFEARRVRHGIRAGHAFGGSAKQQLAHGTSLNGVTLQGALDVFEQSTYHSLKSQLAVLDGLPMSFGILNGNEIDVHRISAQCSLVAAHPTKQAGKMSLDRYLASKLGGTAFPICRKAADGGPAHRMWSPKVWSLAASRTVSVLS